MNKKLLLFLIFILLALLIILILIFRNRVIEKLEIIPEITLNISPKSNIIVIGDNSENNFSYCSKHNIDYYVIPPYNKYICINFFLSKYEYVIYLSSGLNFIDDNKDIRRIINQAGENDMIICRDENNYNKVNLDVIIFRQSEWSKYKIKQLYHKGEKINIILDQVYTDFNIGSLKNRKNQIDKGIPFMMSGICIYNEHAFNSSKSCFINKNKKDDLIFIYPWNKIEGFVEVDNDHKDLIETNEDKISKYIFQTMETTLMTENMNKHSRENLIQLNPEYKYFYFTSLDCSKFIKDNYDEKVFKAYDKLLAGAFKADLFRYCLLYKYGGIYCDSRFLPLVSFSTFIDEDLDFVIPTDYEYGLWQGFMAFKPKNDILKMSIELTVQDILNDKYISEYTERTNNWSCLSITGPLKIGHVLNTTLGFERNKFHQTGKYVKNNKKYKILSFSNKNEMTRPYICDQRDKIAVHKYSDLHKEETDIQFLSGKEPYADMWKNKRIYKIKLS